MTEEKTDLGAFIIHEMVMKLQCDVITKTTALKRSLHWSY